MKKLKLFNEFYNGFEDYKDKNEIEFDYDEEFGSEPFDNKTDENEEEIDNIDEKINFFNKKRKI